MAEPDLPTDDELIKIAALFAPATTPTSKLVIKLVTAYQFARQSVRDVLRECDTAVIGLTRSADAAIAELKAQLADLETQARQAAANTVVAELEVARLRAEVESLRPNKTITTENTAMCSHCGERMPCLYHNALEHIVDKAFK